MPSIRTFASQPIPAPVAGRLDFLIGQDRSGHWLAIETHGLAGGIFASRDAALHYAGLETGHRPGAVHLTADPIELRV